MATPKTWTLDLPVIYSRCRGVLRQCSGGEVRVAQADFRIRAASRSKSSRSITTCTDQRRDEPAASNRNPRERFGAWYGRHPLDFFMPLS